MKTRRIGGKWAAALVVALLVLGVSSWLGCRYGFGSLCGNSDTYDQSLTFLDYCLQSNYSESEVSLTVAAMKDAVGETDCDKAAARLSTLQSLDLQKKNLSDLRPLNRLSHIRAINLLGNKVEDIRPLATLTELRRVNLHGNRLNQVEALAALQHLNWLDLSYNQLKDLAPLRKLNNLALLRLDGNPIEDVSPLKGLMKLASYEFFDGLSLEDIPLGRQPAKNQNNCPQGADVSPALHAFCTNQF